MAFNFRQNVFSSKAWTYVSMPWSKSCSNQSKLMNQLELTKLSKLNPSLLNYFCCSYFVKLGNYHNEIFHRLSKLISLRDWDDLGLVPSFATEITVAELPEGSQSVLEFLKEPFLWAGRIGKFTRYRIRRERFANYPNSPWNKWATPLDSVTHCLTCGGLTIPNAVCPHCYAKVREQTKMMMDEKHSFRKKQVKDCDDSKEMDTFGLENAQLPTEQRPAWFSQNVEKKPRK